MPLIGGLWLRTWAAAPTIAMGIESLRPRTFAAQHQALVAGQARQERAQDAAARQAANAPEAVAGLAVLGAAVPERGDAAAFRKRA